MHTWLMPLAREMHGRREPVLDGLAGDVLLKSLFVDSEVVESANHSKLQRVLCARLSGGRINQPRNLTAEAAAWLADAIPEPFHKATAHLNGHPAAATLSVLLTRTVRAIAASPIWIFGPEVDVRLPFIHPAVVSASLQIPLGDKIGGTFTANCCRSLLATKSQICRPRMTRGLRHRSG
jgi:hypothetical protein